MKKQLLVWVMVFSFLLSFVPAAKAAVVAGFNPGLAVAAVGSFAGGAGLYLWGKHISEKAKEENINSMTLKVLGVILIITGAVFDEEKQKGLKYVDMKQDLEQKVAMGIYTQQEADAILMDYASKWESKYLTKFDLDLEHKTGDQILKELSKPIKEGGTGLEPLTLGYILAATGIQTSQ